LKLIVAEDDPAMQRWLKTILLQMGASVQLVSSGWELLAVLAENEPVDLVISDVRMPIPGGIDALAMARTAGVTVPFLLITAFGDDRIRDTARGLHAHVLDKPFLARDLKAQIHRLIGRDAA